MPTCVHGDVCRTWMMSDRIRGNAPLVCTCPNGCKFFRPKSNCTKVVERKYSSGPYGYVEKTTTTYSEVDGAY
jgi:hypothetical protein